MIKYLLKNPTKSMKKSIIILNILIAAQTLQGQSWQWLVRAGGSFGPTEDTPNEMVSDIKADSQGNVYICGRVCLGADFNGTPMTTYSQIGYTLFLAKIDCNGNPIWVKTAGGLGSLNEARSLVLDAYGNIYLTGRIYASSFNPCTFFDSTITESTSDLFLAKFDTSGSFKWVKWAAPGSNTLATRGDKIVIDSQGMINIAGRGGDFSGVFFPGFNYSPRSFVARFDTAGNINRMLNLCADIGLTFYDYKISPSGDQYITGFFISDSVTIGTQVVYKVPPLGDFRPDLFLAKFDSAGVFQWVRHIGGNNFMRGYGIDFLGNDIILTGTAANPSTMIGSTVLTNPLVSGNSYFPFIARITPTNNILWASGIQNATAVSWPTGGVTVKGNGIIAVTGFFNVKAVIGNDTLYGNNIRDIFLAELNANGVFISATKLGGTGSKEEPKCITHDSNNNIYVGGGYDGTITINGVNYQSAGGNSDAFVAKFGYNCTTGMEEEPEQAQQVQVYPNPAGSIFYIGNEGGKIKQVEVYNILGERVYRAESTARESRIAIKSASWPSGIYVVIANINGKPTAARVMVHDE
jgi:hypothetical protein